MKEKLIVEISNEMAEALNVEQMALLNGVLLRVVSKYNITADEETKQATNETNESLLHSFLSAKQVEGCSGPTVRYYGNTIQQLYKTMPKRVTEYTTEDIRAYLAVFQRKRKASRVTVDNVRRIFSSFFAWLEEEDYIIKSPVRRIHKVKTGAQVKEVLTDESLENLRDTCVHPRDLAMIDLLASTGMRVGELSAKETRNASSISMPAPRFTCRSTSIAAATKTRPSSSLWPSRIVGCKSLAWRCVCARLARKPRCQGCIPTSSAGHWQPWPSTKACPSSRFRSSLVMSKSTPPCTMPWLTRTT